MGDQLPYYEKAGIQYPRVTHILKVIQDPDYEKFRNGVSENRFEKIMSNAANRGTSFHSIVEKFSKGEINHIVLKGLKAGRPELFSPFETFYNWATNKLEKFILVEKKVFDKRHNYAGTPDFIAVIKGRKRPTLFDIKFKAKLNYKENMQTAAYVPPSEKLIDEKIGDRQILQFNVSGKMKIELFNDQATDFGHFLYCLALWKKFN